ncbi:MULTISPECIES: DUF962 domain-containing protein [Gammaproteobacteria]|uniref:DUF962 domain-containing protein n=1 Tax=Gammaproteobacteria TaxID=1236 RepID=UPI000DD03DB9|nr:MULTISPECIES: DUF962 domain-containing protein [Gammaproteobacteria]RTE86985.1 DUF962 domain-containing protein [Aliidiomarina sp. B3213]TCZ93225.1 DUF962 domain-containing protein [Lysobacter sp. N42]
MAFTSFKEFYPYYLKEHSDLKCRVLHYVGSTLVLAELVMFFLTLHWGWLVAIPLTGYGFAWIGHFVFEKNKPATFKHPWYSLAGDWVMYKDAWVYLFSRKKSAAAKQAWGI